MANVSNWTEGILLTLAFVAAITIVVSALNLQYGQNYDVGFSDSTETEQAFINYQDTAEAQIKGGEVEFDAQQGISLKSSYGMAKDAINIVWGFLTGGFIEEAINSWNVGPAGTALARAMRIIWFLSLVFALLYALFKIRF